MVPQNFRHPQKLMAPPEGVVVKKLNPYERPEVEEGNFRRRTGG